MWAQHPHPRASQSTRTPSSSKPRPVPPTHRPRPATQCTATQLPGSSQNLAFSKLSQSSTTLPGGGAPSSNGQSCRGKWTVRTPVLKVGGQAGPRPAWAPTRSGHSEKHRGCQEPTRVRGSGHQGRKLAGHVTAGLLVSLSCSLQLPLLQEAFPEYAVLPLGSLTPHQPAVTLGSLAAPLHLRGSGSAGCRGLGHGRDRVPSPQHGHTEQAWPSDREGEESAAGRGPSFCNSQLQLGPFRRLPVVNLVLKISCAPHRPPPTHPAPWEG